MSGTDGSPFERFLLQGDSVLDRWNNSRLVKRKIPFSPEALQRTAAMAGLRSNLLQQVIYFSHDPLNIQLLLEPLPKPAGDRFPHPDDSTSERLFIQAIALLEALQELRLPQPDFKCWTLKESGTPQFGWSAPLASSFTAADIFELFRESPCLQRFGPQHAQALYRQLKTRYEFTADHCYLYWIGHFSTHILYGHPAASERSATNIKIRIHTQNEIQKEALLNSLYQAWHSEQVLILKADLARMPLRGYFEHRLFARPPQEQSASQLLHAFRCFQEQSAFEHTVMLLDNLDSDEDQELLNCLLDSEEIGHLTIVVLGGKASLDFDLELREDPPTS